MAHGKYSIPTGEDAFNAFQEEIKELGFTSEVSPHTTAYSIQEAAELDYDKLNQYWADWIDAKVEAGEAAIHLVNEDWEDYV